MRRARGNIILTALFVAVFLFFLSIALIWTNRQDIALSLAMEHKMKGEAAARTGAMRVFAALRNVDVPPPSMEGTLENGTTWKAELVELPPEGDRGALVLLHCRGTSGPLSSYYTMHLLKSELGKELTGGQGRMLTFLEPAAATVSAEGEAETDTDDGDGEESEASGESSTTLSSQAKVLFSDFVLKSIDLKLDAAAEKAAAYQGPLFVSAKAPEAYNPLQVVAYVPVFSLSSGELKAYGPVALNVPPPLTENVLSVMLAEGEQFVWKAIPLPEPEPDEFSPPPIAALDLDAPAGGDWTTLGIHTLNEIGNTYRWRDEQPATESTGEAQDLSAGSPYEIDLNSTVDWGSAKITEPKRGYALRGAIAAYGENVYSHAWEYLYNHYDGGSTAPPVPATQGSTVTRWPCIRSYNLGTKKWSTAWSGLKDNGDVFSEEMPSPDALVVNHDGVCWSLTSEDPPRLLRLDPAGPVSLGPPVPSGKIFLYREQPHTVSQDPKEPGIKNLITGELIGFDTLPARLPEISGPVVAEMENEEVQSGLSELETTSAFEGGEGSTQLRTVRCRYDLSYEIDPQSSMASDGDDLYTNLTVALNRKDPTYELFGNFEIGGGGTALARYDGQRWHILPHGLMGVLTSTGVATPGKDMYCAHYNDTDKAKSRYTVVSIDTDPFEFSR